MDVPHFSAFLAVKNKFSCHVLSKNAILIAPNFAFYCGVCTFQRRGFLRPLKEIC
jgi:hypothetical protein